MRGSDQSRRPLHPLLLATSVLAAVGVGALIVHYPTAGRVEVMAGIAVLAIACFLPPFLFRASSLSSGFVYSLVTFATLGLGGFAWIGQPPLGAVPGVDQHTVARALLTVAAAMIAFWIGYRLAGPPRAVHLRTPSTIVSVGMLFTLFALGMGSNLLLFMTGRLGFLAIAATGGEPSWWQQWVITAAGLTTVATSLAALHAFGNDSKQHRRALVVMLIANSAVGVLSGYKSAVFLMWLVTLFVHRCYRHRLPLKSIVAGILVALVMVPANLAYRQVVGVESKTKVGQGSTLDAAGQSLADSLRTPIGDRVARVAQWSSVRFRDIDSLASLERLTPSRFPYLGVQPYAWIPAIALMPRMLWPGKPVLDTGVQFGHKYMGLPSTSTTSVPITNVGDLYLHSGMWGVALGMVIWGALAATLFSWYRKHESPAALLVYLAALLSMAQTELDLTNLIVGASRAMLLAWVVGRVLYGPMPVHPNERGGFNDPRPSRADAIH